MLPFGWPSVEVAPLEWITHHRDLGETNVAVEDSQDDNRTHTHNNVYNLNIQIHRLYIFKNHKLHALVEIAKVEAMLTGFAGECTELKREALQEILQKVDQEKKGNLYFWEFLKAVSWLEWVMMIDDD